MAEEKTEKSTETKTSTRKRAGAGRAARTSNDLDLAIAESRADGEGFNHPHSASVPDLESITERKFNREDLMDNLKEYADKARDTAETVRRQAGEFAKRFEDVPAKSREVFDRVDSSTRANPWLSVAVTGVGALAIGFLAGKLFAKAADAVGEAGYDFDQAMDE